MAGNHQEAGRKTTSKRGSLRAEGQKKGAHPHSPQSRKPERGLAGGAFWLYGLHAARAALANPRRMIRRVALTERVADELRSSLSRVHAEVLAPDALTRLLPQGAVHQGVGLLCEPLPLLDLEATMALAAAGRRIVAILDQVTDPHNEGAILRSAAAFGVSAVVVQDRHAPPESGALAKAASGALDIVPRVVVVNIARALEALGRLGFWRIALTSDGEAALSEAAPSGDIAIALGAEGAGLRRLVRERCDTAAWIPTVGAIDSLNVSNAAAIAFYELRRATTKS
jgi:23S rRNA (guanosine2251-2'-O)-methyltransferase